MDNIGHPFSPYLHHLTSILVFMLLHYCYCMHLHDVYECARGAQHACGGQPTAVYSQFSPSTFMKVPGIEPRSPGLHSKCLYILSHFNGS